MERTRAGHEQRVSAAEHAARAIGPARRRSTGQAPGGEPLRRTPGAVRDTAALGRAAGRFSPQDGSGAGRGWVAEPVESPFVRGTAHFEVTEDGTPTGRISVEATVTVLGTVLARLTYTDDAWRGRTAPDGARTGTGALGLAGGRAAVPLPSVAVDEGVVGIRLDAGINPGRLAVDTGDGARPMDVQSLTMPVPGPKTAAGATGEATAGRDNGLPPGPPATVPAVPQPVESADEQVTTIDDRAADHLVISPDVSYGEPELPLTAGETGAVEAAPALASPVLEQGPAEEAPGRAAPGEPAPVPTVEPPGGLPAEEVAGAPTEVALRIPPAPDAPSPAQQERITAVTKGARRAARSAGSLPDAQSTTAAARGAVTEPPVETAARAGAALADALGMQPAPRPQILQLCDDIRRAIRSKRPLDEKHLVEADPKAMAKDAGQSLSTSVEGDAARAAGGYDGLQEQPTGTPETTPQPLVAPTGHVTDPGIGAPGAAPDPIPPQNVSLDADKADLDKKVADARIDRPSSAPIPQPPFSTVREGQQELGELAATRPADVLAKQDEALAQARTGMADLQTKALEALNSSRAAAVTDVTGRQSAMVGTEQQTRESVSRRAQQIFTETQTRVDGLLTPLTRTAMEKWGAGVERHSTEFRQSLDRVARWIEERHSGAGGLLLEGWDAVAGLPAWVTEEYDSAERLFGDRVCDLLLEISADVESVIAAAKAVIDDARRQLGLLFGDLPAELRAWAATEQAAFTEKLNGLDAKVDRTRDDFTKDLTQQAVTAVAQVQREVEQLREAAGGLIGKVLSAVEQFLDDPVKAIIEGLLLLVGIPPPAFWALVARVQQVVADIADDPQKFGNNLVAALAQGFQQFFDHFPDHLLKGFFNWLFRGLGSVGVQIPTDFGIPSIITFALQLMGLTWARIRGILVKHIGEKDVALIEKAWDLVSALIKKGPQGILEMLKEKLDPGALFQQILDAAIAYVTETLVKQVALRILGMLNPAGAVLQAIELIYKVLRWIFENAASIFKLVETVVNGAADILAGNTGGMAKAVEGALSQLLPIVIDLLAGMVGLGDLPEQVVAVIKRLQDYVFGIAEAVIGWLVTKGRALLATLGIGGADGKQATAKGADEEIGQTVTFSAAGESHRHWIKITGATADLMVASTPTRLEAKLTEWEQAAPQKFTNIQQRAEVLANIATLRTLVSNADIEADRLARQQAAEAAAQRPGGPGAQPAPRSDDEALEQRQRDIARVLGLLFKAFGASRDADLENLLVEISAQLPLHGRRFAARVHQAWWERQIRKPVIYEPSAGAEERIWREGVTNRTEDQAIAFLGHPDIPMLVRFYFYGEDPTSGSSKDPVSKRQPSAQAFGDYLFTLPRKRPPSMVRAAFLTRLGEPAAERLRLAGEARLAPDADDHVRAEIGAIAFRHSLSAEGEAQYGRFDPFVGSSLHPGLAAAVRAYGKGDPTAGVVPFLAALVVQPKAGGLTFEQFSALWNTGGATRSWIKDRFRDATPSHHEWLPVDRIRDVMVTAVDRARKKDIARANDWMRVLHELRTPTHHVVWSIGEIVGFRYAPGEEPKPIVEIRAGLHVGGGSVPGEPTRPAGTANSAAFHDLLRQFLADYMSFGATPREFITDLRANLDRFVWDGSTAHLEEWQLGLRLGIDIRVDGVGWRQGMTVGELAEVQRKRFQQILEDFDALAQTLP
ncbi:hypothetical protein GR925_24675 [Streptomyces sp. HUCO-GS316]|uniref:hypothetical protein n=1 Tax=Streptomyces sp. HUCO-GS316 TaxID=2692198 RepID=UPI0013689851|nr:hypothetical protein [Streptomyces sp. HUCO-GS316]MXM66532.1 hypothetical protein [Streptomyces sp. HUCO-GS316]